MSWTTRKETQRDNMAHGITFVMFEHEGEGVRGEAAIGERKAHLEGKASLTLAIGQYKYGTELIAQLYTKGKPEIRQRRANGYNRIQVYLGKLDAGMIEMLEQLLAECKRAKEV